MTYVGQLPGARQRVDLDQRMHESDHHLLLVGELHHWIRELLHRKAKHWCRADRAIGKEDIVCILVQVYMPTFNNDWQSLVFASCVVLGCRRRLANVELALAG